MLPDYASLALAERELPGPKYEYTHYEWGKLELEPTELWFLLSLQCHLDPGRTGMATTLLAYR